MQKNEGAYIVPLNPTPCVVAARAELSHPSLGFMSVLFFQPDSGATRLPPPRRRCLAPSSTTTPAAGE